MGRTKRKQHQGVKCSDRLIIKQAKRDTSVRILHFMTTNKFESLLQSWLFWCTTTKNKSCFQKVSRSKTHNKFQLQQRKSTIIQLPNPPIPEKKRKKKTRPSIIGIRHFNHRNSRHCDFFSLYHGFRSSRGRNSGALLPSINQSTNHEGTLLCRSVSIL